MLNVALFNKRAKQWYEENPNLKGNMRDPILAEVVYCLSTNFRLI